MKSKQYWYCKVEYYTSHSTCSTFSAVEIPNEDTLDVEQVQHSTKKHKSSSSSSGTDSLSSTDVLTMDSEPCKESLLLAELHHLEEELPNCPTTRSQAKQSEKVQLAKMGVLSSEIASTNILPSLQNQNITAHRSPSWKKLHNIEEDTLEELEPVIDDEASIFESQQQPSEILQDPTEDNANLDKEVTSNEIQAIQASAVIEETTTAPANINNCEHRSENPLEVERRKVYFCKKCNVPKKGHRYST